MIRFINIFTFLLLTVVISACSIVGVSEWNAYKVTIEVRDTSSELIADATITSTADEVKKAESPGTYSLLYAKTGLQVVTIAAPGKQTKQIKISVPADQEKVFSVILNDS